jgi:hypothetical protein
VVAVVALSGLSGALGKKMDSLYFFSPLSGYTSTTLFATSTCGANMCKWALCTTTSFQLRDYTGCIRHVFVLGQCNMVTIGGCGSILRALGVSQILVFVVCRPVAELLGLPAAAQEQRPCLQLPLSTSDDYCTKPRAFPPFSTEKSWRHVTTST